MSHTASDVASDEVFRVQVDELHEQAASEVPTQAVPTPQIVNNPALVDPVTPQPAAPRRSDTDVAFRLAADLTAKLQESERRDGEALDALAGRDAAIACLSANPVLAVPEREQARATAAALATAQAQAALRDDREQRENAAEAQRAAREGVISAMTQCAYRAYVALWTGQLLEGERQAALSAIDELDGERAKLSEQVRTSRCCLRAVQAIAARSRGTSAVGAGGAMRTRVHRGRVVVACAASRLWRSAAQRPAAVAWSRAPGLRRQAQAGAKGSRVGAARIGAVKRSERGEDRLQSQAGSKRSSRFLPSSNP